MPKNINVPILKSQDPTSFQFGIQASVQSKILYIVLRSGTVGFGRKGS